MQVVAFPGPKNLPTQNQFHWPRRIFHAVSGVVVVALSGFFEDKRDFALLLILGTLLELSIELLRFRLPKLQALSLKAFGPLMREGEQRRLSGVPYYAIGCTVSFIVFPKPIAVLAVLFLAFGDPAASIFGIYFKKGKLISERMARKSWQGTGACFLVCFATSFLLFPWLFQGHDLRVLWVFCFALVGGGAAALAEYIPFRTDDNLSLPLVAGSILWLYASLVGLVPGLVN